MIVNGFFAIMCGIATSDPQNGSFYHFPALPSQIARRRLAGQPNPPFLGALSALGRRLWR